MRTATYDSARRTWMLALRTERWDALGPILPLGFMAERVFKDWRGGTISLGLLGLRLSCSWGPQTSAFRGWSWGPVARWEARVGGAIT